MRLQSTSRETPFATFAELQAFRAKAVETGFQSIATGALIGWNFCNASITSTQRSKQSTTARITIPVTCML